MEPRKYFQKELEDINHDLLKMGTLVEESIRKAIRALVEQDTQLAEEVIQEDARINELEIIIEDKCTTVIATQQPVASDLRFLITVLKIVSHLERMGDHGAHIAKSAIKLADETYMKPLIDIPRMAEIVNRMIHEIISAVVKKDAEAAEEIASWDDEIDQINDQVTRELLTYMMQDPKYIPQSNKLIFVCRYLERLGDHVTNISEWIVYTKTAKHIELNL